MFKTYYGSDARASLLEKRQRVVARNSRHGAEMSWPSRPGGKRTSGSGNAGGAASRRDRTCSTKGRWFVAPCDTRVRRDDRRRWTGTWGRLCQ